MISFELFLFAPQEQKTFDPCLSFVLNNLARLSTSVVCGSSSVVIPSTLVP